MYQITDLKPKVVIRLDNKIYQVVSSQHTKLGRGGAIMRTTLRDLESGAIIDKTFKGEASLEPVELDKVKAQYLYHDQNSFYFMNTENFEQIVLNEKQIGNNKNFLREGQEVELLIYRDKPLSLSLPAKMKLKVTYTEPGTKGDTATTALKPATLETDFKINVPLFIKNNDEIIVNTDTGKYVERA